MPKDPTKNVDRYKIRGGQLNEFDFNRNQEQFAEYQESQTDNLIPGTPPEKKQMPATSKKLATKGTKATKAGKKASKKATTKKAATKKATKTKKAAKSTKKKATTGATAKKLAARKSAKKK